MKEEIHLRMCGDKWCKKCQLNFVKGNDISGKCVRIYLEDMLKDINHERD